MVRMNQFKNEDDKEIVSFGDQDQWENVNQVERLPEFDVIGTPLNDI
ncbi:hypothetical protein NDK43_06560 [Neobacillus pocheonensis]|uniref:Uncharacterized protein n=1 Tax=Neobacillus pocheonensis TaxID=363869 RepID=A0ABT0WAU5_9BACI|nr:hypothetical protein [Neobacillus pocheonensis]